tara:strand:+ start:353 stop:1081 length:729 start_codon:yes stop_codon:yes gene_type:complete
MTAMRDETMPGEKWEFDQAVAEVFDDMLERSIPGFAQMRSLCNDYAAYHLGDYGLVVDLGCSKGGAIAGLLDDPDIGWQIGYVGLECSEPMVEQAVQRFAHCSNVTIAQCDLIDDVWPIAQEAADVVLSVLTLQFVALEYRPEVLDNVYKSLRPGGTFLLTEKVMSSSINLDDMHRDIYYDHKRAQGYTEDQINAKRRSLRGVLVPLTVQGNEELLCGAGFDEVECFWRHGNFAGWVAKKNG